MEIDIGSGTIRLRGRIDRIDRLAEEQDRGAGRERNDAGGNQGTVFRKTCRFHARISRQCSFRN